MIDSKPVVLVTGASSGIGLATTGALHRAGYRAFGTSRQQSPAVVPNVVMLSCDVTDDASVEAVIAAVLAQAGRIDLLVNNAGHGLLGAAEESSIDQARTLFDVNVFGTIRMVKAVLPAMRAAGRGRIINVSSVFGLMPAPYMALYAASKHAVEGYTESLDHEIRRFGIRALTIEPANTKTAFNAHLDKADRPQTAYDAVRSTMNAMVSGMDLTGDEPSLVAETILKAAQADKPQLRYAAGRGRKLAVLRRFVPADAFDKSLRKQLGIG